MLSFGLKNTIVPPIIGLSRQISEIAQDRSLGPVDIKGPAEIVTLADSFNNLSANLRAERKENSQLKMISITDELTSLYNHRHFFKYLRQSLEDRTQNITLLFSDIDFFKMVNDVHGHVVGDNILREIGSIISSVVSHDAKVFRYGGEEFAVILENCEPQKALKIAEKIRLTVAGSQAIQRYSGHFPVTLSIGMSSYPSDALNVEDLVNNADKAMYYAKHHGRNQCRVYSLYMDNISSEAFVQYTRREMLIDSTYSLAAAIDAKDSYTEKHSEMVTAFALQLAEKLQLSEQEKYILRIGGLLHDVGKIGVPDEIIHKNGPLTEQEWVAVKNHTSLGSKIVRHIIKTPEIDTCIRSHHERWDGKRIPRSASGSGNPNLCPHNLYCRRISCHDF